MGKFTVILKNGLEIGYATAEEAVVRAIQDKCHACGPRGWLVTDGKLVLT